MGERRLSDSMAWLILGLPALALIVGVIFFVMRPVPGGDGPSDPLSSSNPPSPATPSTSGNPTPTHGEQSNGKSNPTSSSDDEASPEQLVALASELKSLLGDISPDGGWTDLAWKDRLDVLRRVRAEAGEMKWAPSALRDVAADASVPLRVRLMAIFALGVFPASQAADELKALLASAPREVVAAARSQMIVQLVSGRMAGIWRDGEMDALFFKTQEQLIRDAEGTEVFLEDLARDEKRTLFNRELGVQLLGRIQTEDSRDRLIGLLEAPIEAKTHGLTLRALGAFKDEKSESALIDFLEARPSFPVRYEAISSLGRIGTDRGLGVMMDSLSGDEDLSSRAIAAQSLGAHSGRDDVRRALRQAAESDEYNYVRRNAVLALSENRWDGFDAWLSGLEAGETDRHVLESIKAVREKQ